MTHRMLQGALVLLVLSTTGVLGQTSKFLAGDTLFIPPETSVSLIGGNNFVIAEAQLAVIVGKRYPYWYVDFYPENGVVDSAKVGNSFFLAPGIVNRSLESRVLGLDQSRKLSRLGVDVEKVGGNVEQAIDRLAGEGVPVLIRFSYEISDDGGVEPKVRVYNISDERIRSLAIDFHGVDARGNPVHCTKSGKVQYAITMNGPINPDDECYFAFVDDPAFFNEFTACLEIDRVTVTFLDGDAVVMEEDLTAIQNVLKSPFMRRGECPS